MRIMRPFLGTICAGLIAWCGCVSTLASQAVPRRDEILRQRMVDEFVIGNGVTDQRVVRAMLETARHEFVPVHLRDQAYEDMALPIGDRQTISSPFIVAFMTEALDPQPTDKVLEIGTGSGYQAAVLSPLVREVYTIEIVESLGESARRTLTRLRYENVHVRVGDGFQGWPEQAPFDKIIVTCSPEEIPVPLIEQLRDGGLMVIPTGHSYQQMLVLMRKRNGQMEQESLRPTLFVPMTGVAEEQRRGHADPLRPRLVNPGFEAEPLESGFIPGWYYQRQLSRATATDAPEGSHYVTFQNAVPGKHALAIQGFAIDGRQVRQLELSAWVKCSGVRPGQRSDELPVVLVSFYDEHRNTIAPQWLGPFRGTQPWQHKTKRIRVPPEAREGFVRLGLFGAVGQVSLDDVQLRVVSR
jgi:protein-L-isoaspartate(D-aspartate) O-methyltransferase